jgi:hypothetical protein
MEIYSSQRDYGWVELFNLRAGHAVVSEEQPEAKDWLGEDIENGIGNNLSVEPNKTRAIGDAPDAAHGQYEKMVSEGRLTLGKRSRG